MGIALEREALTGNVLLKPERTEAGDLRRGGSEAPGLRQAPLAIYLLQLVLWQHGDGVEQPFADGAWLRQVELNRVLIDLPHRYWPATNTQQLALG